MHLGQLVATRGVANEMESSIGFALEVIHALERYLRHDWGDVCPEDKELNDEALQLGNRLLGAYETRKGKIWVITEWDRSVTTILFPSEY